jgi:signal transduction histidine kinase
MKRAHASLLLGILIAASTLLVGAPPKPLTLVASVLAVLALAVCLTMQRSWTLRAAAALALVAAAGNGVRYWAVRREPALVDDRVQAALERGRANVERSVQELLWLGGDLASQPSVRGSVRPEGEAERRQAFETLAARLPWAPDRRAGVEVLDGEGRAVAWAGWVSPTPLGLLDEALESGAVVGLVEGETYTVVKTVVPIDAGGAVVTERALQVAYPFESRFLPEGGVLADVGRRSGIHLRIVGAESSPGGAYTAVRDTEGGVLAYVEAEPPAAGALSARQDLLLRRVSSVIAVAAWLFFVIGSARLKGDRTARWLLLIWGSRTALWYTAAYLPWLSALFETEAPQSVARLGFASPGDALVSALCLAGTVWVLARALPLSARRAWAVPAGLLPALLMVVLALAVDAIRSSWPGVLCVPPGPHWLEPLAVHGAVLALSLAVVLGGWLARRLAGRLRTGEEVLWAVAALAVAVLVAVAHETTPLVRTVAAAAAVAAPQVMRRQGWVRCLAMAALVVLAAWGAVVELGAPRVSGTYRLASSQVEVPSPVDVPRTALEEISADSAVVTAMQRAGGAVTHPLAYRAWAASALARAGLPSAVWLVDSAGATVSSFAIGMPLPQPSLASTARDTVTALTRGERADQIRVVSAPLGTGRVAVASLVGRAGSRGLPEPLRPESGAATIEADGRGQRPWGWFSLRRARRSEGRPPTESALSTLTALSGYAVFFLLPVGLIMTLRRKPDEPRYGFRRKLTLLFLGVSLVPLALLTVSFLEHLSQQMDRSFTSETILLLGTARAALQEIQGELAANGEPGDTKTALTRVAGLIGEEVGLFRGGELVSPSHAGLYDAELLPTRMNGLAFKRVELEGRPFYVSREWLGSYPYVVGYAAVETDSGELAGTLCLPRLRRQEAINARLTAAVRIALTGASIIAVGVMVLGSVIANRTAKPLKQLRDAASIASSGGHVTVPMPGTRDEIASLVQSFNRMTEEVATSRMALEQKRAFMEAIVANLGAGLLVVEPDGLISLANPSATGLLQLKDDPSGRPVEAVLDEPWLREVRSQIGAGKESTGRLASPGSARIIQYALTNLPAPSGTLLVIEDVTDTVQWHKNVAWAQMARHVAHEVKNPLTPIKLSAQHLEQVAREEDTLMAKVARRTAATITAQAERLERIAREFSALARAGAVDLVETDLNRVVDESVGMYEATHLRGVSVRAVPSPDKPICLADPEGLRRVLSNLIDNALSATPAGGSIEVRVEQTGDGQARLTVRDTGCGMGSNQLEQAFEPGFTTKPDGTGLGLAIVREMVDRMGGTVALESTEGEGTTVTVSLPIAGPSPTTTGVARDS